MTSIRLRVLPALVPTDGREVELQQNGIYIQWRYSGDADWVNLIALADITGPEGPAIELRSDGTNIQYRQVGDVGWINIVPLDDIRGATGPAGPTGSTGPAGSNGTNGTNGVGVPTGGTTNQVLAKTSNTNYATTWADPATGLPTRYWQGYQHSNNVSTPNTKIDLAAGSARDSTDALNIVNTAGTIDCGTVGANGLDAGSLANSIWYYSFAITTAAGVTAYLASTSPTAPTMPATYTKFRRVGSFKTNGSAQILPFTHVNDTWYWTTTPRDVNSSTQGTTAILYALSVPRVLGVVALFTPTWFAATIITVNILPGFLADTAKNGSAFNISTTAGGSLPARVMVDSSGQVKVISTVASTTIVIDTLGWIDQL